MSGRAQRTLLLCSAASLAFVVGALVLHAWFWVGVGAIVFAATVFAQPWASSRVVETRVVFDKPQTTPKSSTTPLPKPSTTPLAKPSTTPLPKPSTTPLPAPPLQNALDDVRMLPVRPSPPPLPPPDDLIPVAPESGLTIRKRSETRNLRPRANHVIPLAPEAGLEIRIREPVHTTVQMRDPVERHAIGFDDIDSQSGSFAFSPSATVKDPIPPFARAVSRPVAGTVAPPVTRAAMSAQELATLPLSDIAERLGGPTIKYAVTLATLTLAGIEATRRDGSTHVIEWDAIKYVVARRLPSEEPFDGATFVDIVSTPGATLRILSWTTLVGMPTQEVGEARARTLVNLIAARCVDVKVDPATELFAQHDANAVQLPTLKLLAMHDERFA